MAALLALSARRDAVLVLLLFRARPVRDAAALIVALHRFARAFGRLLVGRPVRHHPVLLIVRPRLFWHATPPVVPWQVKCRTRRSSSATSRSRGRAGGGSSTVSRSPSR